MKQSGVQAGKLSPASGLFENLARQDLRPGIPVAYIDSSTASTRSTHIG